MYASNRSSNDKVRQFVLKYLYDRNANARSARSDSTGAAVKISVMRRDLKALHSLSQSDVRSNLTYLISQGWVEEQSVVKQVQTPRGGVIPSTTSYYIITAAGIDKIEGPGEFTMDKFRVIKIEATGQNVITVGDGNQINAKFRDVGETLSDLKEAIRTSSQIDDLEKIEAVGDIDSIQSQLAKSNPNAFVVASLWENVERIATLAGLVDAADKVATLVSPLLT